MKNLQSQTQCNQEPDQQYALGQSEISMINEIHVCRNYTKLPMPDSVIKKVDLLADKDKAEMGVMFRNRKKENFDFKNEEYERI